ncbi:ParB N-terminal domain-containing protein [Brevibacillus choshinensis]|uniref:ParB N-terminal domain-containing protein n=1 Tax=Brevibacillus choshinensis TaxID=54911 RepID=A0ABX7FVQ1_BRECH|nr:ParB N-terminal domain-containing protein [Brevibacillus choshinensis]QRG70196.1 ParB N-terminal domain-containing protein [Brevibacillus choshinensis]
MKQVLSSIQVIESSRVCLHEDHEPSRLKDTCKAILEQGVLLHPPLAKRMEDGRYLILDGAHRTAAMREIGCHWLPVQVVNQEHFQVEAWDHLVPMGSWLNGLLHDPSIWSQQEKLDRPYVAQVIYPNGKRFYLYALESQEEPDYLLRLWHRMVASYNSKYRVHRVPKGKEQLPTEGMVLLRYPSCTMDAIEQIVLSGQVTCQQVSPVF